MAGSVKFFDEDFRLADDVNEFALMEFAESADAGVDGDTMQGMAAMLRLILGCLAEDQQVRFRAVARKNRAAATDLMPVIQAAFEVAADRPTGLPSDSSAGPNTTAPRSPSNSAGRVSGRLAGRPDLQLQLLRAKEAEAREAEFASV